MVKFLYDPHADEPETIGWQPPIVDQHGMTLVPSAVVAANHAKSVAKFKAGRVFEVDELSEPHLYKFVSTDRRFRKARRSDLKESA
jgi:hypothetical protein